MKKDAFDQLSRRWKPARLIPLVASKGVEYRATSATLAVLSKAPDFSKALLAHLGAPTGKVDCYLEVRFPPAKTRPDGCIAVTKGNDVWVALVEVKTAKNRLTDTQVDSYLKLVSDKGLDALLTISNEFGVSAGAIHRHLTWSAVVAELYLLNQHHRRNPLESYIIDELLQYLSDETKSGVASFSDMGPEWTAVCYHPDALTGRRGKATAIGLARRWVGLTDHLGLCLTHLSGSEVSVSGSTQQVREPFERRQDAERTLLESAQLSAGWRIEGLHRFEILVDLSSRKLKTSVKIDSLARGTDIEQINRLLRQLEKAPGTMEIASLAARKRRPFHKAPLNLVRSSPQILNPGRSQKLRAFELTQLRKYETRRTAGPRSFIRSVENGVTTFYETVVSQAIPRRKYRRSTARRSSKPAVESAASDENREGHGDRPNDFAPLFANDGESKVQ